MEGQDVTQEILEEQDVTKEILGVQDVTEEILEGVYLVEVDIAEEILEEQDVTKEIFEEQKERSHADPTTTLVWVGLWQSLTGLNPTHC